MLQGCGTTRNFEKDVPLPGHENDPETPGSPGSRQIYEGVLFDLETGTQCLFDIHDILPFWHFAGAYLVVIDLPLSFVTDTLTLPWTIKATMNRVNSKQEPKQNGPAPPVSDPAALPVPPPK
jgi:uncharacterized protein YceK